MKCPICGKELELRNKQIGTNENGDPIFNEYAICRDCKKQWNLDKQRAKRAAKKAAEKPVPEEKAPAEKPVQKDKAPAERPAQKDKAPAEKPAQRDKAPAEKPVQKDKAPARKPAPDEKVPVRKPAAGDEAPAKKPVKKKRPRPESEEEVKKPIPKKLPRTDAEEIISDERPARKPVKKRSAEEREASEEKRYSNIPSEKVRNKHGKAARKSYTEMLETGESDKKSRNTKKKPEPKPIAKNEEYDDEDYYDDEPRFRPMRVILAILSLAGFGYLIYKGFVTGLTDTTEGSMLSSGMTYIIISLCMLVSALLYFIMLNRATVFAFLLPMIFYLGGGVFAFLQRGDDLQLLIAAVAGAVLAVISLILAITSRGGYDDEEEDYDDAFEDDYADEDYDD